MKNLRIYSRNYKVEKPGIHRLIRFLSHELQTEVESLDINIINTSQILEINKKYLSHDYLTDIITFDYSETGAIDGELFICYDVAAENAMKYSIPVATELDRLIIHGLLHLTGYNDQDKKSKRKMKSRENKLLSEFIKANET